MSRDRVLTRACCAASACSRRRNIARSMEGCVPSRPSFHRRFHTCPWRRRCPYSGGAQALRACRTGRRHAAHRAQSQRPGGYRSAHVGAPRLHGAADCPCGPPGGARYSRGGEPHSTDARVHASAARAGRVACAPSARVRRDARPRRATSRCGTCRLRRAATRKRRACGIHAAARSRPRGSRARLRARRVQQHGRRLRQGFRRRDHRRMRTDDGALLASR